MRFLVTGAGGMIGANVALWLESQGHEVQVLDQFLDGRRDNLKTLKGKIHQGDIRTFDYSVLGRLDGVFHQAACTDTTVMDETFMLSTNQDAHLRILEYALKSGCPKVVYASSAATYGKTKPPNRETTPPAPANIYGVSKARMEEVTRDFCAKHPEVKAVGLRYFNVYGPLEFHKKKAVSMVFQLYKQISDGKAPRVFKWGEQYRDFIYVKDVVQANWKAFQYAGSGAFNVGTGVATSFNDVIAALNKALGASRPTEYIDNPYSFYQEATQADMSRSEKELGFKAAHAPAQGIADYVSYLRSEGKELIGSWAP
jgi:ADP-L-glycero-D-manno-heptose 6-epimerase